MAIIVVFCLFLIRLHFIFHQPLLHALDLVDQKNVTKLTTPSGRVLYQVGTLYLQVKLIVQFKVKRLYFGTEGDRTMYTFFNCCP